MSRRYEIGPAVVNRWVTSYEKHGIDAFASLKEHQRYGGGFDPLVQRLQQKNVSLDAS